MFDWLARNHPGIAVAIKEMYRSISAAGQVAYRRLFPKRFLEKYPLPAAAAAVLSILVLSYVIWQMLVPARPPLTPWATVWCYDLGTGKPFAGSENAVPPFATPGGALKDGTPAGVRAEVFACGSCADKDNRFVGWLWKFTPGVKERVQKIIDAQPSGYREYNPYQAINMWGDPDGQVVASEDNPGEWVSDTSEEAAKIKNDVPKHCAEGQSAQACPVTRE